MAVEIAVKVFRIMGEYRGKIEEIDEAYSRREADHLVREYRISCGDEWRIWVEDDEDE